MYLLCNDVIDCVEGEDEAGCEDYTCPGFYRCWRSRVCVHVDHVCDGIRQCPEQDDELLCDFECPHQCHCQGLAFVCSSSFTPFNYPSLRFLNGSFSNTTLAGLSTNIFLIHVILSHCDIQVVDMIPELPNLRIFDVSNNHIKYLSKDVFIL